METKAILSGILSGLLLLAALLIGAVAYRQQQLHAQDADAPVRESACNVFLVYVGEHSRTYQLTCTDPQPDSLTLYPRRTQ